jgi:hypothetical protein
MKLKRPNFSKGPWKRDDSTEGFDISDADGTWIATVYGGRDEDEADATAISALPEVMDALELWHAAQLEKVEAHKLWDDNNVKASQDRHGHAVISEVLAESALVKAMLKMGYTKEEES